MSRNVHRRFIRFPLALCLVTASIAQTDNVRSSGDLSWSSLIGSMKKMHIAMASIRPSSSSDVDFASLMLPHHQAAIDMAKSELLNGKDPQMRRLAQEIITDQQSEIELMQLWLKQRPVQK